MKRLGLYVFHDKQGMIRNCHEFYLRSLLKCVDKLVVIVNGILTHQSRCNLENLGVEIVVRENVGFDFYAWKEYILDEGFLKICKYDELVLCNCSCYGPIYPFTDVFESMNEVDCDFWGLYEHPEIIDRKIPHHLQSYFLVLREKILNSIEFRIFWSKLKMAFDWNEAVKQEIQFTKYFENSGYRSACYTKSNLSSLFPNPTLLLPVDLLKSGFPLIKKKVFTESYSYRIANTNASQGKEVIEYLKYKTNYPVDYIYEDLIQSLPNSALHDALHLTFILEDKREGLVETSSSACKIASVVYSWYEDLIDYNISYLKSLPINSDIFVVVVSSDMEEKWDEKKEELVGYNVYIRRQQNRGRNELAYWITCKDVIDNYDYICLIHDKKTPSAKPRIRGKYFSDHCMDNVLKSKIYVDNIIDVFNENPRIGILMPVAPLFADLTKRILNREWATNREIAIQIYNRLNLSIPFDNAPLAPLGAMFWIRGKAMKAFYRYNWTLEDFPVEPLKVADGTVLHALERLYPMIVQESGFLSAWVIPASEASIQYDNIYYQLKLATLNHVPLNSNIHFNDVKKIIKKYLKKKIKTIF